MGISFKAHTMGNQNIFLASATLLLFAASCNAFKISSTRDYCPPKPATMATFDAAKFLGDWYQVNGLPFFASPAGTSCIRATYGADDNNKVSVRNTATTAAGKFDEICGYADIPNPETAPAELLVHFHFASVYACVDVLGIIHIEFAWVLVRDPQNVTYEL